MNEEFSGIPTLKRHHYPLWIRIFFVVTIVLFFITSLHFVFFEFRQRSTFYHKVMGAKKIFDSQDYINALVAYKELMTTYPNYTHAKLQLAKSYFALSAKDVIYLSDAFSYFTGSYTVSTINEVRRYVPDQYRELFEGSLEWKIVKGRNVC
jgi:hypothetical protein